MRRPRGWANTVIRGIAIGVSYIWDAFKMGVGIVQAVIGQIIRILGGLISMVDEIAGTDYGAKLTAYGRGVRDSGFSKVTGFGNSADATRAFFDDLEAKRNKAIKERADLLKNPGKAGPAEIPEYKPIAAALKGSQEAAKIAANFDMEGVRQEDLLRRGNQLRQQGNQLLGQLVEGVNKFVGFTVWACTRNTIAAARRLTSGHVVNRSPRNPWLVNSSYGSLLRTTTASLSTTARRHRASSGVGSDLLREAFEIAGHGVQAIDAGDNQLRRMFQNDLPSFPTFVRRSPGHRLGRRRRDYP